MNDIALKAEGLTKTFIKNGEKIEAVRDVSFSLAEGEIFGIAGESGSGKSTLSRLCMRLLAPDSGEVYVCGELFSSKEKLPQKTVRAIRPKIQMVFQNPADTFNPAYSLGAGLREAGRDLGLERAAASERISELLKLTGLDGSVLERRPKELSGGQLQRLAIVRALICRPKVLIADEAVSSLDVSVSANILNLLLDLREKLGISILFISHDLAVIGNISDRVGVMYKGSIIETGRTEEVLFSPKEEYTKRLLNSRLD